MIHCNLRTAVVLVALVALAAAGCPGPDGPPRGKPAPVTFRLAHVAAPSVEAGGESARWFATAVSELTAQEPAVDLLHLTGSLISNRRDGEADLAELASLAGILPAPAYATLGRNEASGVLPKEQVVKTLGRHSIASGRHWKFAPEGRGVVAIGLELAPATGGEPAAGAAAAPPVAFLEQELRAAAPTDVVIVAATEPIDDRVDLAALKAAIEADPRVKVVLSGEGPPSAAGAPPPALGGAEKAASTRQDPASGVVYVRGASLPHDRIVRIEGDRCFVLERAVPVPRLGPDAGPPTPPETSFPLRPTAPNPVPPEPK